MITIPAWLLAIPAGVIVALSGALVYVLVKSGDLADRQLDRELHRPPMGDQLAEDIGGSTLKGGPTDG